MDTSESGTVVKSRAFSTHKACIDWQEKEAWADNNLACGTIHHSPLRTFRNAFSVGKQVWTPEWFVADMVRKGSRI